jgi:hypothetical protein
MSVLVKGPKKLQINTAFGGSLTAADVRTGLVSVSMSVLLKGPKKLRINTAFGGSLTDADVRTGLV